MSINKVISLEDDVKLLCLPSMEDIDGVVLNMKKWKASGPDGFLENFLANYLEWFASYHSIFIPFGSSST